MIVLCLTNVYELIRVWDYRNPFWLSTPRIEALDGLFQLVATEKAINLADSFFIVGNQHWDRLSTLHIVHHATMFVNIPLLIYLRADFGTMFFPTLLNSAVHALMYGYYATRWKRMKKFVTITQIVQLTLCAIHGILVLLMEQQLPHSQLIGAIQFCYMTWLLVEFLLFYRKAYTKRAQNV